MISKLFLIHSALTITVLLLCVGSFFIGKHYTHNSTIIDCSNGNSYSTSAPIEYHTDKNEQIAIMKLTQTNLEAEKNVLKIQNKKLMSKIENCTVMETVFNNIENDWLNYCKNKHYEANKKIVESYVIKEGWSDNTETMLFACLKNDTNVVTALLDLGFNIDTLLNGFYTFFNGTCLHFTANNNNVNLTTVLINRGANINAKNNDNDTPTIVAAYWGNLEVLTILVEKGADLTVKDNKFNKTALEWARDQNQTIVINYLVSVGAPE